MSGEMQCQKCSSLNLQKLPDCKLTLPNALSRFHRWIGQLHRHGSAECISLYRPCLLRAARSEIIFLVLISRTHLCWFITSHSSLRDPLMRVWYTVHDRMHVCFSNIARRRHDILLHHASLASSTITRAQVTSPFHYYLVTCTCTCDPQTISSIALYNTKLFFKTLRIATAMMKR